MESRERASSTPSSAELRGVTERWLAQLETTLKAGDFASAAALFSPDSYWRDLLSFTWTFATFEGPLEIERAFAETTGLSGASDFCVTDDAPSISRLGEFGDLITSAFSFNVASGAGRGVVRLHALPDGCGEYRAFILLTTLDEIRGFPEQIGPNRPHNKHHEPAADGKNWLDRRRETQSFADREPQVLIVGAGQSGLATAARLERQKVSTLIIERSPRVGDSWRNRYSSLHLHNEIYANHLPYMPFPETWPVYLPKDMVADWFELYASAMELNVWTSTELTRGAYDEQLQQWEVEVARPDGSLRMLRPRYLVLAAGICGLASVPALKGAEEFEGGIVHSTRYAFGREASGKRVLVVGAGSSAHDIAQDLCVRGADVTMLQRSPITVASIEPSTARMSAPYRALEGVGRAEDIDLVTASVPISLLRRLSTAIARQMADDDRELLDGLRKAGFLLDNDEDSTGWFVKQYETASGYYLNVGGSDLIISGAIKLKAGVGIERLTRKSVIFTDGSAEDFDAVVLCTGYQSWQELVRALLGSEVADKVGPIWGLGPDGELRNVWKPTRQNGFFVVGSGFASTRIYSKYLALYIRAAIEGVVPAHARDMELLAGRT